MFSVNFYYINILMHSIFLTRCKKYGNISFQFPVLLYITISFALIYLCPINTNGFSQFATQEFNISRSKNILHHKKQQYSTKTEIATFHHICDFPISMFQGGSQQVLSMITLTRIKMIFQKAAGQIQIINTLFCSILILNLGASKSLPWNKKGLYACSSGQQIKTLKNLLPSGILSLPGPAVPT